MLYIFKNFNYETELFLLSRHGVYANPFQEAEDLKNQSVVYVGVDNTLAGLVYFEDQIREDAGCVVESLSGQGINVYMLSGDKRNTAEYVASAVGIPKEKVRNYSFPFHGQISGFKDESLPYFSVILLKCYLIPELELNKLTSFTLKRDGLYEYFYSE